MGEIKRNERMDSVRIVGRIKIDMKNALDEKRNYNK